MKKTLPLSRACLGGLALSIAALVAQGKEEPRQIVLTERLNQTNGPELVSFPFEAKKGECIAESVQVSGPRGSVPAQLTGIVCWPAKSDKFVKSARLCFV